LRDPVLRGEWYLDTFACRGMDAVAVEEFEFFGGWRKPGFVQAIVFESEVELAFGAEDLDGEGVEEFVGEDDERSLGSESAARSGGSSLRNCSSAGIKVVTHGLPELGSQCGRSLLQRVSEHGEEVGEFLIGPVEDVAGKESAAGAKFQDFKLRRAVECLPHFVELAGEQAAEDGVHVAWGIEVPGFSELIGVARIITLGGVVKADLHVARKREGAALADFLLDLFSQVHVIGYYKLAERAISAALTSAAEATEENKVLIAALKCVRENLSFAPLGLVRIALFSTACAVGCILTPLAANSVELCSTVSLEASSHAHTEELSTQSPPAPDANISESSIQKV
jgi:hypothetical protein